ncbi:MAG: hypothetical protein CL886_08505 [Dehalococcoidia bacterium]|nr:hypothetical protein [Dehalococcoidia bacterium]
MNDRPENRSTDWRRQRRSRTQRSIEDSSSVVTSDTQNTGKQNNTLYNLIEPALDAVGSFGTPMVIAGVIGIALGLIIVAFIESMKIYGLIVIIFGAILIGVIAVIYFSTVTAAFLSRTGRYGTNSLIMLAAFMGIILLVNVISFNNNQRWDNTATQQFSLATQTKNLLEDLNQPIKATAFFREDMASFPDVVRAQQMLARRAKVEDTFSEFSNRNTLFSYEFIDPDINPEIARNYGISTYESIVIEAIGNGQTNMVTRTDESYSELEQDLYTSILVVSGQEKRKIYFLSQHGEKNINRTDPDGLSTLKDSLESFNYEVEALRLSTTSDVVSIPDDTALLVIAGPTADMPDSHKDALNRYLSGYDSTGQARIESARLIFMAEPDTSDSFKEFLAQWGILLGEGYIFDKERSDPITPQRIRLSSYNPVAPEVQQIVRPRGIPLEISFMQGASAIFVAEDGLRIPVEIARTSPTSYLIDDIERTEPIESGDNPDPSGIFIPAYYIQAVGQVGSPAPTSAAPQHQISQMVIFGDSDFATNKFVNSGSGESLFLNSANYLLGDFSLVSIHNRQTVFREFNLDKNEYKFVRLSSWFFLPVLMGLLATLVWWIRR